MFGVQPAQGGHYRRCAGGVAKAVRRHEISHPESGSPSGGIAAAKVGAGIVGHQGSFPERIKAANASGIIRNY